MSAHLSRYVTRFNAQRIKAKSQQTPSSKQADKAKKNLDDKYSYLAGNAFGRDKKGRVKKEDPNEMHGVEGGGAEYTAYVYYDFEFN